MILDINEATLHFSHWWVVHMTSSSGSTRIYMAFDINEATLHFSHWWVVCGSNTRKPSELQLVVCGSNTRKPLELQWLRVCELKRLKKMWYLHMKLKRYLWWALRMRMRLVKCVSQMRCTGRSSAYWMQKTIIATSWLNAGATNKAPPIILSEMENRVALWARRSLMPEHQNRDGPIEDSTSVHTNKQENLTTPQQNHDVFRVSVDCRLPLGFICVTEMQRKHIWYLYNLISKYKPALH
jgi:hypothetical protein